MRVEVIVCHILVYWFYLPLFCVDRVYQAP